MLSPASPVIVGFPEMVYAKDQPQYISLPAIRKEDGEVITRWKLTFLERITVLFTGNIYLSLLTFNQPLQPIKLTVDPDELIN